MQQEAHQCQNCQNNFSIEPDDFAFYEKMKVPAPTFCPACRYQRRLMVRNERNFYKRECELCKKGIISMYSADKPFPVFCSECWWGDSWDPMQHGAEYDFEKPFFVQMHELQNKVPRPNLRCTNMKNSDYCNYVADAKDSYLCFGSIEIENCMYGSPYESKYCVDTYLARESEYCYECVDCEKLSNCSFCQDCSASLNLLYCYACKNCQDCIGCVGLRNKKYHIFNQAFSKEKYLIEKEKILDCGRDEFGKVQSKFESLKQEVPHRFARTLHCTYVSGDYLVQSKNVRACFDVKRTEDCAHCIRMIDAKDTHDTNYCEHLELCYEYIGFWKMAHSKFSNTCGECTNVEYSDFCSSSSYLFGCVGLRNKQYCILNKQYSKEEYASLIEKIKIQMDHLPYNGKNGRIYKYGEFFPAELSLFAYNESVAHDFFPLAQQEIINAGFYWKETEGRNYSITLNTNDVPSKIIDVADAITKEVIGCAHEGKCLHQCTTAFRITPEELQFYKRMKLPLPLSCPNCRHYERLAKRNPPKLWHRACMKPNCQNVFESSYAPERPEIICCEQCYQQEFA